MKLARFVPIALFCTLAFSSEARPQEKKYDARVKKVEVRGGGSQWFIDLTIEHTFIEKTLLSVEMRMMRHEYWWREKELMYGPENQYVKPVHLPASSKVARTSSADVVSVSSPGLYQLVSYFNPDIQTHMVSLQKAMGRSQWYRRDFPVVIVVVGEAKKMVSALQNDTEDCAKLVASALDIMDRIEKQSDDKDWTDKAQRIFDEVGRMRMDAEKKAASSFHAGTYRAIIQILDDLVKVGQQIKMMKDMKAKAKAGGGGGGDEELPSTHPPEGNDTPIIPSIDGKTLSLDKMQSNILVCGEVRIREYFSWLTIFHLQVLDRLDAAHDSAKKGDAEAAKEIQKLKGAALAANEDVERAFKYMREGKAKERLEFWSTYQVDKQDQKYSDFFSLFRDYVEAVTADAAVVGETPESVKEARAKIRAHIDAARTKVTGRKS